MTIRVGIVAAEPSGDLLAGGLMQALRGRRDDIVFEGIGGPSMAAQGLDSWVPLEKLSVMGLVEVLRHLPSLLAIRRDLVSRWRASPPDLFIGIDAPDFNLGLETRLRGLGVPTVQYVSPTVWAWREGRVKKIRRAADLVLSIFPFEESLLRGHGIVARYVGHPLAVKFPQRVDRQGARKALGLDTEAPVLAILPGSRGSEIAALSQPFLETALACGERIAGLQLVAPMINRRMRRQFEAEIVRHAPGLDIHIVESASRDALSAADTALVASGTATFEALLCKCPMVVGYKANPVSYGIVMGLGLLKTPWVAMANILAGEALAPEFIQQDCVVEKLAPAVLRWFEDSGAAQQVRARYREIHAGMNLDTDELAAQAVIQLLETGA